MACGCVLPSDPKVKFQSHLSFSLKSWPFALRVYGHGDHMCRDDLSKFERERVRGRGDIAGARILLITAKTFKLANKYREVLMQQVVSTHSFQPRAAAVPDTNREMHNRIHDPALCAAMGSIRRVVCIMTTRTLPRLN